MSRKGKLGLKEVVAMGVGGMVSGGIYAVLGVAMKSAGNAVPLSFLIAGLLTLVTAYSYLKLTLHYKEEGGAFSFIEHTVENKNIAGFFGWVLIIGYIGVMAMYAFAFGSYLVSFFGIPIGSLTRRFISVGIVGLFVGLNILGVKETGFFEDITVYIKITLLLGLAALGIFFFPGNIPSVSQFFNKGVISPISAFAVIFVSYEGFQLLTYDYKEIKDVKKNLKRGTYIAITIAILIYISVSFMASLHLTPQQIVQHKEFALAKAVVPFLGSAGFIIVVISALKSTSSGINATLFGASRLAHKIATEKELPRVFSFRDKKGIPTHSILILGFFVGLLAFLGTLEQITAFGSVIFLIADAAANYSNLKLYKKTDSNPIFPVIGLGGCLTAIPIVLHHLYLHEPGALIFTTITLGIVLFIEVFQTKRGKYNLLQLRELKG